MVTALGILLVLSATLYVGLPFWQGEQRSETADHPATPEERERWERYKAEAYAAIKEAELDQRMGKLSDVDFATIREKYAGQALEAIAALDRASEERRAGRKPVRIAYCPSCGHTVPPRASFCPGCGVPLREAVA